MIPKLKSIEDLYDKMELAGEGVYARVYKVYNKQSKKIVAVKIYKEQQLKNVEEQIMNEIKLLKNYNHPNVITLTKFFQFENKFYLEYQYMDMNLLDFYLNLEKNKKPFEYNDLKNILRQILSALCYLHQKGFMHRDLKPENILLDSNLNVKIADLASCAQIERKNLTQDLTTLWYRAPEQFFDHVKYDQKIDIFAFGCIAVELAQLKPIFCGENDLQHIQQILSTLGDPPKEWTQKQKIQFQKKVTLREQLKGIDPQLSDLIELCLKIDPKSRPNAHQLLHHQYFQFPQLKPSKSTFFKQRIQKKKTSVSPEKLPLKNILPVNKTHRKQSSSSIVELQKAQKKKILLRKKLHALPRSYKK